jgi:hypothetical protein
MEGQALAILERGPTLLLGIQKSIQCTEKCGQGFQVGGGMQKILQPLPTRPETTGNVCSP